MILIFYKKNQLKTKKLIIMKNKKKEQEQMVLKPREELDLLSNKSGGRKNPQEIEKQEETKAFSKDKWDML